MRFTTRSLMLVTLLAGLNLGAALATSRHFPRPSPIRVAVNNESAPTIFLPDEDGIGYVYRGDMKRGRRIAAVRREPLPPTLLEIWSPVMFSVSISLLILLVPHGGMAAQRRRTSIGLAQQVPERRSRGLMAFRVAGVVLALIVLDLAGVLSGPRPLRSAVSLEYREFFGGMPRILVVGMDGVTIQRRPLDLSKWAPPASVPPDAAFRDVDGYDLWEATIEYRRDGSIVAYAGTPERKSGKSCFVSPPAK
jgi:hypothetical protein